MSDSARYRVLERGLRRARGDPFRIRIAGADPLELRSADISPNGATTSFQVHLRVAPLGLFTESVRLFQPLLPVTSDQQPQDGRSAVQPPPLNELRLHQGTVWRWNRAIYDPAAGGHLRIELRALPAGPTMLDMLANAAFLIGLSLWLAGQDQHWNRALSFERAEHDFYRAAQHGLAAELTWPFGHGRRPRTLPTAALVLQLLATPARAWCAPAWPRKRPTGCSRSSPPGRPAARPAQCGSARRWPPSKHGSAVRVPCRPCSNAILPAPPPSSQSTPGRHHDHSPERARPDSPPGGLVDQALKASGE
jgi:hypothetical protein